MESIDKQILKSIKKCGRGLVLFADRFSHFGTPARVQKAMEQLVASGDIIRVARGIYCYPKIDKMFGLGVLYPDTNDIAKAIAFKDKAQIVPTGEFAQYQLGLTQQIPMNVIYLTDGYSRTVKLISGGTITFKHVAPRNFAYKNKIAMMVTSALRTMGQNEVTEEHIRIVQEHLRKQPQNVVFQDLQMMPDWIKLIVQKAYE
jgi:hypothetical protein